MRSVLMYKLFGRSTEPSLDGTNDENDDDDENHDAECNPFFLLIENSESIN